MENGRVTTIPITQAITPTPEIIFAIMLTIKTSK